MMNNMNGAIKKIFNSRSLKYGSNAVMLTAIVVAIAVVVNLLLGMLDLKWDLTKNKLFSIGDTTKSILTDLKQDVIIYGLFDEGKAGGDNELKEVMDLLNQYKKYPHIKVVYQDPDKNPGFIKSLDPDNVKNLASGDFVVKNEASKKLKKLERYDLFNTEFDQQSFSQYKTGSNAEQAFTGAVKYVTSERTPTVYFTEGHDEKKVDSEFKVVKDILERNNYEVKSINLLSESKVPQDAEVLVIASPKKDLVGDEKDKLKDFLKNGGKAIFLVDTLATDVNFSQLDDILKDYNVALNYDKIKEEQGSKRHLPPNRVNDIIPEIQNNAVNSGGLTVLMPGSRSINTLKNQKEYITVTSLAKTSGKAVGEQIDKARGRDNAGPLDVALAVEDKGGAKASKIVVVGNSTFMSDTVLKQFGFDGLYFMMNSLSWMQDKKDEVVIAPKSYAPPRLDKLTAMSANVSALFVIIVLPLIIFGFGTFVWMRRRHL